MINYIISAYYLPYYKIKKEKFGFLNLNLENKGHRLIGTFYDTDDLDILDRFIIYKDNENRKKITSSEKEVESFLMVTKDITQ